MKRTYFNHILFPLACLLLMAMATSCVHEGEEDKKPTPEADFTLKLDFSLDLPPYTEIVYDFSNNRANPIPDLRYTVLVFPEDETIRTPLYSYTFSRQGEAPNHIDVPLKLPHGTYRFMVWADYVKSGSLDDFHYSTDQWQAISINSGNYSGCDDSRDAFRGASEVVATVPDDTEHTVNMVRPLAKYRFVSTDFDIFLERVGANQVPLDAKGNKADILQQIPGFVPEDYYVQVRYTGYLPSAFNLFTNRPSDATTGITYRGEFEYVSPTEVQLGFDYVFVNGKEAIADLAIDIYNKEGERISSSPSMSVPMLRSHLTTIRGNFLTCESSGAIGVNPDFEGSFDIIIQ